MPQHQDHDGDNLDATDVGMAEYAAGILYLARQLSVLVAQQDWARVAEVAALVRRRSAEMATHARHARSRPQPRAEVWRRGPAGEPVLPGSYGGPTPIWRDPDYINTLKAWIRQQAEGDEEISQRAAAKQAGLGVSQYRDVLRDHYQTDYRTVRKEVRQEWEHNRRLTGSSPIPKHKSGVQTTRKASDGG